MFIQRRLEPNTLNMNMKKEEYKHPYNKDHKYNESVLPQAEQKHMGWYYDHLSKQFFRWDNFPFHSD